MKYSSLSNLLEIISVNRKLHISIHINSEYFSVPELTVPVQYKTHTCHFCDIAKSTQKGFRLCIRCKTLANNRAKDYGVPFAGHCPYGLYEYARPVRKDGRLICIIYIGNMITDRDKTLHKLHYSASKTGVDADALIRELQNCMIVTEADYSAAKTSAANPSAHTTTANLPFTSEAAQIADLIAGYILLLTEQLPVLPSRTDKSANKPEHSKYSYRVKELTDYIKANYTQNITIKQLAGIYFVNEKYLGRTFKKETGYSVHEYLNLIRLDKASDLLAHSDKPVLDIALECGFGNVSHFNRCFKAHTGLTPTAYRTENASEKGT